MMFFGRHQSRESLFLLIFIKKELFFFILFFWINRSFNWVSWVSYYYQREETIISNLSWFSERFGCQNLSCPNAIIIYYQKHSADIMVLYCLIFVINKITNQGLATAISNLIRLGWAKWNFRPRRIFISRHRW